MKKHTLAKISDDVCVDAGFMEIVKRLFRIANQSGLRGVVMDDLGFELVGFDMNKHMHIYCYMGKKLGE